MKNSLKIDILNIIYIEKGIKLKMNKNIYIFY